MIYLDNAATTFPKPQEVYEEVIKCMKDYGANPGRSGHTLALEAGRAIYDTRELVSEMFNIENPMNIIFTSNGTEGLNTAIKGVLKPGDHVITSTMEHNSVLRPLKVLEKEGVELTIIKCNDQGFIDIEDIEKNIKSNTKVIVTTHASNIVGTLFPIEEIGQISKNHNLIYVVDAAQTAGVYDIDVESMNIDILVASGHKSLLGPQGTGIMYISPDVTVDSIKQGGTGSASQSLAQPDIMPDKFESGTPNTPGIVGLGQGVKFIMDQGIDVIREHEQELARFFLEELSEIEEVTIYGPGDADKQAAVVSINIKGADSSEIGYLLDSEFGIAVRTGLHCAPLAHETIGTFESGAIRFSFGYFNTKSDVEQALEAIKTIIKDI